MPSDLPRLFLARHGDTAWTDSRQRTGRTDLPLNERGEERARQLGERLRDFSFARVFTKQVRTSFLTRVVARSPDRATRADRRSPCTARTAPETCARPQGRGPETTPQQAESVKRILPTCLALYSAPPGRPRWPAS